MNGYVKRMVTVAAAVFTLALVLAACGGSVDEGQVISFEGKDLNGNVVNSEELFGSHDVTMVNLWSSTCQGCEDELGELSDLNDRVNPAGGCVIGLIMDTDMDDAVEKCRAKLEQHGATYINIPATEQMRKDLETNIYPLTYFVDSDGKVLGSITGNQGLAAYENKFKEFLGKDFK